MGLSRVEAWSRWGLIREIEPLTQSAYEFFEWLQQRNSNIGESVEDDWHLSFHGSQFPGDNPYACPRKAIYQMMDIPRMPFSRTSRAIMEAGKDIENRIVIKWYLAGYLLSAPPPPFGKYQTVYEDVDHMLTSTVDAIVVHPKQNFGKVVEVKTKYRDDIDKMLKLCKGPDPAHIGQLKCQIGLAHEEGPKLVKRCYNTGRLALTHLDDPICPQHFGMDCLREVEIASPDYGFIKYVSRDKPDDTWEFMYEYDSNFMEVGRTQLSAWKDWWNAERLPQTGFSDKRFSHPFDWTWTKSKKCPDSPCQYCEYGDICREDHKLAVATGKPILLADSAGIGVANEIRPDYELNLVQMAVEKRWSKSQPVKS